MKYVLFEKHNYWLSYYIMLVISIDKHKRNGDIIDAVFCIRALEQTYKNRTLKEKKLLQNTLKSFSLVSILYVKYAIKLAEYY